MSATPNESRARLTLSQNIYCGEKIAKNMKFAGFIIRIKQSICQIIDLKKST